MSDASIGGESDRCAGGFALLIGAFGACLCMILVVAPDLLPAYFVREGFVWSPINSQQFRIGDAYYYAAWVAEVLRSGVPPESPSAAELSGQPLLEAVRWFPLAVAALPGFVTNDFRVVYIVNFAATAIVIFGVPFLMAWRTMRSAWGGFFAGVALLFFIGQWWSLLPLAPGVGSPSSVIDWLTVVYHSVTQYAFGAFFNIYESEALQGSFRYINNSVSAPLLLIYVFGCFELYRANRINWPMILLISIMSPLMAFSYPSRTIVAYFVLGGLAAFAMCRRYKVQATTLVLIGVGTLLLLFAGGYFRYVQRVFAANELWNNIFEVQSRKLVDRPFLEMLSIAFLNKYILSFGLSLVLVWRYRCLRDLTIVVGVLACALACTALFDMSLLWPRFLDRGIDHVWFMCLLLSIVAGWKSFVLPNVPRVGSAVAAVFVLFVIAVPAYGFGTYAFASSQNLTRQVSIGRWDAIQWIKKNVHPGTPVTALDWTDIAFIPIYTSAKLVVDNMIIGGRSPEEEVRRYVASWRLLSLSRSALESRLTLMVPETLRRRSLKVANFRSPPLTSAEQFAASQLAEAVVYWPYVSTIRGTAVADGANQTNSKFVEWALSLYDKTDEADLDWLQAKYVVISGAEAELGAKPPNRFKLVFATPSHRIYADVRAVSR